MEGKQKEGKHQEEPFLSVFSTLKEGRKQAIKGRKVEGKEENGRKKEDKGWKKEEKA